MINYTHFCAQIPAVNKDEKVWLEAVYGSWEIAEHMPEDWIPEGERPDFDFKPAFWLEFEPKRYKTGDAAPVDALLRSAGDANPNEVAIFLQRFLLKFRPATGLGFEVSYTCSDPGDPGGFGGAAYFVTAVTVDYQSTLSWIHAQYERMESET